MISFIVPTLGRPSLLKTLTSIETLPGDEILVVGTADPEHVQDERIRFIPHPPGGDWGHTERNFATPMARGQYIAHIDDDDTYTPGMRALMQDAIINTPGRPVIFRMKYPCGIVLWADQEIRCGNVGTPMILVPNMPTRFGCRWEPRLGGDCDFMLGLRWAPEEIVWREEIIALLGHNT